MKTSRHDEGRGSGITRRDLIGTVAAIGAATAFVPRATMAALPGRGEFVVRNAHVLTMDPSLGDSIAAMFMSAMARSSRSVAM